MGPLAGIKIIELGGIGPGPFGAMMLADMGAEVIRLDRIDSGYQVGGDRDPAHNIFNRGRRSIRIDLRHDQGREIARRLISLSDVLIEGFRPGVAERLGLGPTDCMADNPGLVYARMTGWGQTGPLSQAAGHDINYIALTGALHAIGPPGGPPVPPLNLVGDLGGGGAMLAYGVVCALLERSRSGKGQVVDAAIVDGVATLMAFAHSAQAAGMWSNQRGGNMVDGGEPWYAVYQTSDGKFISIGAIEPKFYQTLLQLTGLDREPDLPDRADRNQWPELRRRFEALFATKTRDEWCALLEGTDSCFAPVLELDEAASHRHMAARGTYISPGGITQPSPSPRLGKNTPDPVALPPRPGQHTDQVLSGLGLDRAMILALRNQAVVA